MNPQEWMRLAIEKTREGIRSGQTPFGAVAVRNSEVIASAHNTVWRDLNPTAHAEINAITLAATQLRTIHLRGVTLYSTCEPCPMCLAAIHWSKIDRVVFGASIEDAAKAGFCEIELAAKELVRLGRSTVIVEGGYLREECYQLFEEWKKTGLSVPY